MYDMTLSDNSRVSGASAVAVGNTYYHWRYGPLTIVRIESAKMEARIEDHGGIVDAPDDPWMPYVHDVTKWWSTDSVGRWLFAYPDDVGQTAGLATHDIRDADFLSRLHRAFDQAGVVARSPIDPALKATILEAEAARREREAARKREEQERKRAEQARRKEQELEKKRGQRAPVAAELQRILDQEGSLEEARARLRARFEDACAQLADKSRRVQDLAGEPSNIKLTANQPEIARLEAEIPRAEGERDAIGAEIDRCDKELGALRQEEVPLRQKLNEVDAQIDALKAEIASLRSPSHP